MCKAKFVDKRTTVPYIIYNIIACFFILFNLSCIMVIFAKKVHLQSHIATHILRNQFIIDFCVVLNLVIIMNTDFVHFDIPIINMVICYLWKSQFLYWVAVLVSNNNMINNSIDRLVAVRWPTSYNVTMKWRFKLYYGILFTIPLLFGLPSIIGMKFVGDACEDRNINASKPYVIFQKSYSAFWFISTFGIPLVILLVSCVTTHRILKNMSIHDCTLVIRKSEIRYTIVSSITLLIFSLTYGSQSFVYVLRSHRIIRYSLNNPMQHLEIFLASLSSMANSIVFNFMLKCIRDKWIAYWFGRFGGPCCTNAVGTHKVENHLENKNM